MLLLVKDIEEMLFERLGPKTDQIKSMWVVVKIMVPFWDPYYSTAPNI